MKRIILVLFTLGLLLGCQQQAEETPGAESAQQGEEHEATQAENQQQAKQERFKELLEETKEKMPSSPEPRVSTTSKIWTTSAEGKPGEQVKIDVMCDIDEPSRSIVVPITFLGNVVVDSFSWVGSDYLDYSTRPTNIANDLRVFLAAVVPTIEPDIPAGEGKIGSIYFSIEGSAPPQTVVIESTFIYPGNTLMYIDTLIGAVTPQWEPGTITVLPE